MNLATLASTRRRLAVAVGSIAAVLSVSLVAVPLPASADTGLWAGFESGTLGAVSAAQNVDVTADCARSGSFGADVATTPLDPGFLNFNSADVTQGMRYAHVRTWVRIDSMGAGQNVPVLNVKNANGYNHFDMWRDADTGRLRYDLYRGDNAYSDVSIDLGQWYLVDVLVDFGGDNGSTYTARVRVDGDAQPSIVSDGQDGTNVRSFWFGGPTLGYSNAKCYDAVSAQVSDSPLSFS